jgi:Raf kinase inhibitor-like YbhB/YbcL family protein
MPSCTLFLRFPAGFALGAMLVALAASPVPADEAVFTAFSPDLSSGVFTAPYTLHAFGCNGSNISPAIAWKNAPTGTKSFALQVRDENVAAGSAFWHWTVYDIPATATGLGRGAGNSGGALPAPAFGGANDFADTGATGENGGYGGPCPPAGDRPHRYLFTVYALAVSDIDAAAEIPKTGSADLYSFVLNKALGAKMLGKATFTALYGR